MRRKSRMLTKTKLEMKNKRMKMIKMRKKKLLRSLYHNKKVLTSQKERY